MTEIDRDYYVQRAREERERAKVAPTPASASVHNELAEEYERMLRALEGDKPH